MRPPGARCRATVAPILPATQSIARDNAFPSLAVASCVHQSLSSLVILREVFLDAFCRQQQIAVGLRLQLIQPRGLWERLSEVPDRLVGVWRICCDIKAPCEESAHDRFLTYHNQSCWTPFLKAWLIWRRHNKHLDPVVVGIAAFCPIILRFFSGINDSAANDTQAGLILRHARRDQLAETKWHGSHVCSKLVSRRCGPGHVRRRRGREMRAPILDQPSISVADGHVEKDDRYRGDDGPFWTVGIVDGKKRVDVRDIAFDEADAVV